MSDDWLTQVKKELGIESEVLDANALLLLARDVARGAERKAAPLTTFLVGYAAGSSGLDREATKELAEHIRAMCPPPQEADD